MIKIQNSYFRISLLILFVILVALVKFIFIPPSLKEVKGEQTPELIAVGERVSNISKYQTVTISHTVEVGDTLFSIAKKYHADAQTIVDYPYNQIDDSLTLKVGQILIIPNGYIDSPPPNIAKVVGSGVLSWPVNGEVTQYASWWHQGAIDISGDLGTPVKAAETGMVINAEKLTGGYGWHVILDHGSYTSLYAHLLTINVYPGESVKRNQKIGEVGATGRSTGPHLHFETRENGQPIDPLTLL